MKSITQFIRVENNKHALFFLGISVLMALFSYFSNTRLQLSLLFLVLVQLLLFTSIAKKNTNYIIASIGFVKGKNTFVFLSIALVLSIAFAITYRVIIGYSFFPLYLTSFVFIGLAIGLMEEFIYRGYLFKMAQPMGKLWVPLLCALSHTIYKTALFASFSSVNLLMLAFWTLVVGLLLGYIRYYSKSIYPCLIFHGVFDVLVYGDQITPWWVW